MIGTLTRAPARTTKQELRRHVLALALFVVLVWHTVVSPSYTAAPLRAADGETQDAEERGRETQAAAGLAGSSVVHPNTPRADEIDQGVDELDWPEIIGDE